jgi:hypothetical protein
MKPQNFPEKKILDGTEEIYTQTSGVSEKFTLEKAKDYIRPYKVYSALLNQKSTIAPSATVLENTLGGDVTWTYSTIGVYIASFVDGFDPSTTLIFCGTSRTPTETFTLKIDDGNAIVLQTYASGSLKDALLLQTSIEIRVYPSSEDLIVKP